MGYFRQQVDVRDVFLKGVECVSLFYWVFQQLKYFWHSKIDGNHSWLLELERRLMTKLIFRELGRSAMAEQQEDVILFFRGEGRSKMTNEGRFMLPRVRGTVDEHAAEDYAFALLAGVYHKRRVDGTL